MVQGSAEHGRSTLLESHLLLDALALVERGQLVDVVLGQGPLPAGREVLLHHCRPGREPPELTDLRDADRIPAPGVDLALDQHLVALASCVRRSVHAALRSSVAVSSRSLPAGRTSEARLPFAYRVSSFGACRASGVSAASSLRFAPGAALPPGPWLSSL